MLSPFVDPRRGRLMLTVCVCLAASVGGLRPSVSGAAGDGNGQPPSEEAVPDTPAPDTSAQPTEEGGAPAAAEPVEEEPVAEQPGGEDAGAEEPPKAPEKTEEPVKDPDEEQGEPPKKKRVIGATAVIKEYQSGLLFEARVDTGAKSCSLNVDQMVIVDEEEGWEANVGKVIKFRINNGKDEPQWIESKIQVVVRIKTSDNVERRYKVPLELQWKNVKKRVTVTLNDRSQMRYPLLVGRNFLKGDFLVDVEKGDTD